jgi:AcrR family transcriptional regulator
LQDVAVEAGTTRGAIYHHFQNKADLYKSLIAEAMQQGNHAVERAIEEGESFTEVCRLIFHYSAEMLEQDERFRQISELALYKTGSSAEMVEIENMRIQSAGASVVGVAAYLQQGIDAGELRDDLPAEELARAFLAFQNGVAWMWLANGQFFSITESMEAMVQVLLQGIRKV